MTSIVDNINNNLKGLYDTKDEIYIALIADSNGTIPVTITKPTDIDIGAIASEQEYLRKVSLGLKNQIFIDQATGEFLKFTLEDFFSSIRLSGETELEWVERTAKKVFQPKLSQAAFILALRPYSSQEPEIVNNVSSSAFAGLSFASRVKSFIASWLGLSIKIYPAIARSFSFSLYSIRITLYDIPSGDINTVINLIESIIAAGITYELVIKSSGNKYMLTGSITIGLFLDIINSESGTLPGDLVSYDDINYDAGTYGVTAVYTSLILTKESGFNELSSIGIGDIFFQFQIDSGPWSAEQDASGTKTFTLSGTNIRYRFIFRSESWSDPDSIIVTGIS